MYDVLSQFPFLWEVPNENASALIRACQYYFQFSGCPVHFCSDRGVAFNSDSFCTFAHDIEMNLHFSTVEYPQSNGAAESAVKILKRLKKMSITSTQLFRSLLYLRNRAKLGHSASPAQIFLGRTVRSPLTSPDKSNASWQVHHAQRLNNKAMMAQNHDVTAHQLAGDFAPGDHVMVHKVRGKNVKASVISNAPEPRSYVVEFANGSQSVHNQKFLTIFSRNHMSSSP